MADAKLEIPIYQLVNTMSSKVRWLYTYISGPSYGTSCNIIGLGKPGNGKSMIAALKLEHTV